MKIELKKLSLENFSDYELITSCESGGGCYCSFWHQNWGSMADWEKSKKETPEINRGIILEKVRSGFHVGVLAYREKKLAAWISVGPLPEFFWTWKRVGELGAESKDIAAIVCFAVAPDFRGKGLQAEILNEFKNYGCSLVWKAIEGYPFDDSALEKHKNDVIWPGVRKGFVLAGFERLGPHWLSRPEAERSIYRTLL